MLLHEPRASPLGAMRRLGERVFTENLVCAFELNNFIISSKKTYIKNGF